MNEHITIVDLTPDVITIQEYGGRGPLGPKGDPGADGAPGPPGAPGAQGTPGAPSTATALVFEWSGNPADQGPRIWETAAQALTAANAARDLVGYVFWAPTFSAEITQPHNVANVIVGHPFETRFINVGPGGALPGLKLCFASITTLPTATVPLFRPTTVPGFAYDVHLYGQAQIQSQSTAAAITAEAGNMRRIRFYLYDFAALVNSGGLVAVALPGNGEIRVENASSNTYLIGDLFGTPAGGKLRITSNVRMRDRKVAGDFPSSLGAFDDRQTLTPVNPCLGVPGATVGVVGDIAIDAVAKKLYLKESGGWIEKATLGGGGTGGGGGTLPAQPSGPQPQNYATELLMWVTPRGRPLVQGEVVTRIVDKSGSERSMRQIDPAKRATAIIAPGAVPALLFTGKEYYSHSDRLMGGSILEGEGGTITMRVGGSINLNGRANLVANCGPVNGFGWAINLDSRGVQNALRMSIRTDGSAHYTGTTQHVLGDLGSAMRLIEISINRDNSFTVWLDGVQVGGTTVTGQAGVPYTLPYYDMLLGAGSPEPGNNFMTGKVSDFLLHIGQVKDHLAYANEFLGTP